MADTRLVQYVFWVMRQHWIRLSLTVLSSVVNSSWNRIHVFASSERSPELCNNILGYLLVVSKLTCDLLVSELSGVFVVSQPLVPQTATMRRH